MKILDEQIEEILTELEGEFDGNHPTPKSYRDISAAVKELREENERLKSSIRRLSQWIQHLQEGRVLTCVYCGHAYKPGTGTSQEKALYEHIKQCLDHPLRAVEQELKELQQEKEQAEEQYLRFDKSLWEKHERLEQTISQAREIADSIDGSALDIAGPKPEWWKWNQLRTVLAKEQGDG